MHHTAGPKVQFPAPQKEKMPYFHFEKNETDNTVILYVTFKKLVGVLFYLYFLLVKLLIEAKQHNTFPLHPKTMSILPFLDSESLMKGSMSAFLERVQGN